MGVMHEHRHTRIKRAPIAKDSESPNLYRCNGHVPHATDDAEHGEGGVMSPGGAVSPQSKRAAKGVTFYTVEPGRESRGISGTGTRRARRPCGGASNMPRRGSRRWFVPPRNQSMAVIA